MPLTPQLVLASASPRRRGLMGLLGLPFDVRPSGCEEALPPEHPAPALLARRLARAKALEVATREPGRVVIGADTIVVLGRRLLGKPASASDARRMLNELSGRSHRVVTGLAVVPGERERTVLTGAESTWVRFRELSSREVAAYVRTREPMDKAGAYAIQGRGALFVAGIRGDYSNVVGMPLIRLATLLRQAGVAVELYDPPGDRTDDARFR